MPKAQSPVKVYSTARARTRGRPVGLPLEDAFQSYERTLRVKNKADQTIRRVYLPRLRAFNAWLAKQGMPTTIEGVRREHIESYILWMQNEAPGRKRSKPGVMPATVSIAFRTISGFFNWAVREDLLTESPMKRMEKPSVPFDPPPVMSPEEEERLYKACRGTSFVDRRDMALVRFMIDSGARRGEVASLHVTGIDWAQSSIYVSAEASKSKLGRFAPFRAEAAQAIDRYLRERAKHPDAHLPWLWLGKRGRLTDSGILQVIERRGAAAGIEGLHPHRLRHQFAHNGLRDGNSPEDIRILGGWKDPGSMARYGASAASERALANYLRRPQIPRP